MIAVDSHSAELQVTCEPTVVSGIQTSAMQIQGLLLQDR